MQATQRRAAGPHTSVCGVLTSVGLRWPWLLHQVIDWWYLQQLVVIEMEKEKKVISWGVFGQLLEVRT